jgi:hypothetical protein
MSGRSSHPAERDFLASNYFGSLTALKKFALAGRAKIIKFNTSFQMKI